MKIYIRKHKYSKNNTKNNNKKTNQTNQQKGFNMKNEKNRKIHINDIYIHTITITNMYVYIYSAILALTIAYMHTFSKSNPRPSITSQEYRIIHTCINTYIHMHTYIHTYTCIYTYINHDTLYIHII